MKARFLLLTASLLFSACESAQEHGVDRSDLPLSITHLRGGIYIVEDRNYWKTNSVFYACDKGIVFVDATYSRKTAEQLIRAAGLKTMADYTAVILTSHGLHRSGGLSAFAGKDIPIIMHRLAAEAMRANWDAMQKQMSDFGSWTKGSLPEANIYVDQELSLLDGQVQVRYPGWAYSPGNLVVFFPREKVLYAGSMLSDPMFYTDLVDWQSYPVVLKTLSHYGATTIVTGHGKAVERPDFIQRIASPDRIHPKSP